MDMLLQHFKTIFDRPEKVKKLRELILQLAVRGKLVGQDENDEPASVLLERIREEKERLIKEKKIKKEKPLPEISEEEKPYEVPKEWKWVRLGEYCLINPRNSIDDNDEVSFVPMKLINDGFDNKHTFEKKLWKEIKSGFTHFANNDVVIAKITPCFENRKSAVMKNLINGVGSGTTELYVVRSINSLILPEYILNLCKTDIFIKGGVETYTGTAGQQRVKRDYICNLVTAIPPLEEQKRIVEKVDSLMAFCDELEKELERKVRYASLSSKSVFNSIGNCASSEELEETLRFIIENFKELTLGDDAVKELKNAILQLAVQGKLVPQDPNDEPASVLLEKIKEEKEKLIKEKKIKKEKSLAEISEKEKYCKLPCGWKWSRLGNITTIVRGSSPRPKGSPLYWADQRTKYHWITISDITNNSKGNRLIDTSEFLTEDGSKLSRYVKKGEIIIAVSGSTVGKTSIIDIDGYIYDGLAAFKNINDDILRDYLFTFLLAWRNAINSQSEGSAFPNINTDKLNNIVIALPPLNEQKRIVEKVDSLMVLCDELEKRIEKSKKYSEKLMESILKDMFK